MKRHAPTLIAAMRTDRQKGLSISLLMQKYNLPKSTVWHQIQNLKLSDEAKKLARTNQGGSKIKYKKEWNRAQEHADSILNDFDVDSAWAVLYAALYWSEGTKSSFVFTNTDERMIQVFLSILRNNFSVKNEELDFMIRTCAPMDHLACRKYWAKIAHVPVSQIRVNHNDKQNKSKTEYGMCRITLKRGAYHLKLVHCLFRTIADKMLVSGSRSSTDRTSHS